MVYLFFLAMCRVSGCGGIMPEQELRGSSDPAHAASGRCRDMPSPLKVALAALICGVFWLASCKGNSNEQAPQTQALVSVRTHAHLADKPAARTLVETMKRIESHKYENNFFTGDPSALVNASGSTQEQQVGACLLDKYSALTQESGLTRFPNDMKMDLAACCMCCKGPVSCCSSAEREQCIEDASPAYDALVEHTDAIARTKNDAGAARLSGAAAAAVLSAATKRLTGARLTPQAQALIKAPSHVHGSGRV